MDLFQAIAEQDDNKGKRVPLAVRMRPRSLDEFVGQQHVLGQGALLRTALENDTIGSLILYGPPGTGKTTLARLIADLTKGTFEQLNAVTAGVADLRRVIKEAQDRSAYYNERTILFIDEIHRFNKSQQDGLLPAVEDGVVTLVGATTENPFFSVNSPLLSRARVVRLQPLAEEELDIIIDRALSDDERGLGGLWSLTTEARDHIKRISGGDARIVLGTLELASMGVPADAEKEIGLKLVEEASQIKALNYDKAGDQHYDTISAWIKSIRGSDPDAALYWLARMLEAGEDPRFIVRRLIVHASEDIGNADPMALVIACQAAQALEWVGLPEARIPLGQATAYLATAPKSNASYIGIDRALDAVRNGEGGEVPVHLRDAGYSGAKELGSGEGYLYPHSFPDGYVKQSYFPEGMARKTFYEPTDRGYEKTIKERLRQWRGGD